MRGNRFDQSDTSIQSMTHFLFIHLYVTVLKSTWHVFLKVPHTLTHTLTHRNQFPHQHDWKLTFLTCSFLLYLQRTASVSFVSRHSAQSSTTFSHASQTRVSLSEHLFPRHTHPSKDNSSLLSLEQIWWKYKLLFVFKLLSLLGFLPLQTAVKKKQTNKK